jgi:hypothetical protein
VTLRASIARRLRFAADRIDPRGAPKAMSVRFTFEDRAGIVFRDDNRGCLLWYYGDDDYERAHDEAGPAAVPGAEVWLPQRVPSGTVLTGRHREPARAPAGPGFTVTLFTGKGGTDG